MGPRRLRTNGYAQWLWGRHDRDRMDLERRCRRGRAERLPRRARRLKPPLPGVYPSLSLCSAHMLTLWIFKALQNISANPQPRCQRAYPASCLTLSQALTRIPRAKSPQRTGPLAASPHELLMLLDPHDLGACSTRTVSPPYDAHAERLCSRRPPQLVVCASGAPRVLCELAELPRGPT